MALMKPHTSPAPRRRRPGDPEVLGASIYDPMQYGASGRGELSAEDNALVQQAVSYGVPMSEVGNFGRDPNYRIPTQSWAGGGGGVSTLSSSEGRGVATQYGLTNFNEYAGLTRAQAEAKAMEKQKAIGAQTSNLTSYRLNPQSVAGFNDAFRNMKFQVDKTTNDPWVNSQEKKEKKQAIVNSYTDQIAKLFPSLEDFNAAIQNPLFQNSLKQFQSVGGDISAVASKIAQPAIVNPMQSNQSLSGAQTIDEYLGAINSPEAQRAYETMLPEKKVIQDTIAFEQSIPEQYRDLYFGNEEQVGLITQKRIQAEEEIKILDRKAKLEENNQRAQARLLIERNDIELRAEEARVEENRMAAKNYMTGMLAKLGALNTTGAAPLALATLEQKYQAQAQNLRTSYSMANKEIEVKLNEVIGKIDIERDEEILSIKGDLSKSEETTWKEILKLQNEADRKTFAEVQKFARDFASQKEKYAKEARDLAEKDIKERQRILEKFNPNAFLAQFGMTDQRPSALKARSGGSSSSKSSSSSSPARPSGLLSYQDFATEQARTSKTPLRGGLVPQYKQYLLETGLLSTYLQNIIEGKKSIADYSVANQAKIRREMAAIGLDNTILKGAKPSGSSSSSSSSSSDVESIIGALKNK